MTAPVAALHAPTEEGTIPRLPAPFGVPAARHDGVDLGADWLVGRARPRDPGRPDAAVAVIRPALEAPLHAWVPMFVGVSCPIVAALPPDGGLAPGEQARPSGARAELGNVEAHARATFPLPMWLEMGFTLGLVVPTATFARSDRAALSVARAAASLDPTSFVQVLPGHFAFRPALDLRVVRGRFVFQGRQGLDVVIDGRAIESAKLAGRLVGHAGWLVSPDVEVSFEVSQIYWFGSESADTSAGTSADAAFHARYRISDAHRGAFVFGPGVRFATPGFDVGAALVANAGAPLSPAVSDFVGVRLSILAHAGARP